MIISMLIQKNANIRLYKDKDMIYACTHIPCLHKYFILVS